MNQHFDPFMLAVPVTPIDHVLGLESARVTLVEYGDFECPSCAQACPAVKILLKHFGSGVRFVYRHFPVTEAHPHAELAAEASEAAAAQNKFWPMHDRLFEHEFHLKSKQLREYAAGVDLDLERYDYEMGDHLYLQRVHEHVEGGKNSGVRGSPAFFVNGAIHDVSFGFESLGKAIEAELRSKT